MCIVQVFDYFCVEDVFSTHTVHLAKPITNSKCQSTTGIPVMEMKVDLGC